MTLQEDKEAIRSALVNLGGGPLRDRSMALLDALGYQSDRQGGSYADPASFHDDFAVPAGYRPDKALEDEWRAIDVLFQLTDDDIRHVDQLRLFDSAGVRIDNAIIMSYVFLAVDLRGEAYSRSQLAEATREINKLFGMPAFILYRHGGTVTPAVINRRLHKRDAARDVLEKVTLIKDIRTADPHRAHIEILHDLSLDSLTAGYRISNFVELHQAWQKTLDSSELNKRFFREIADWYFWAVELVVFPDGAGPEATRNPTAVIRLLTRLIFVWFMKEKGLAPDDLFSREKLEGLLRWDDPQDSAYYKAVLQNLFFATLNQAMGPGRAFRKAGADARGHSPHYGIHNVYRYERYFKDPAAALKLFARIPFLNGGLFECLDRPAEGVRVDGFSDRADNPLRVPDELFFGREQTADLNEFYGTTGKQYKVRGLIDILNHYKFTIDENTPIEEDVALDPELLGKVLENLLAAYNPETNTTARKATGSFYTPREIVNYMVDEALLAYLEPAIAAGEAAATASRRLPGLLAYSNAPHEFSEDETERLIAAIDSIKILDPACGSGAFPMGILHKLVFVLGKLDPGNARWKERQLAKAAALDDPEIRRRAMEDVEATFARNRLDYARKLYLIENCIYGVDIQPIAVQVAKLRFFISLAVDQPIDDAAPNRGILPLPNLETKFVAANTLLGIERPPQMLISELAVGQIELELKNVRHRYFTARSTQTKNKYRAQDEALRGKLVAALASSGWSMETTEKLANWNPYDQNTTADFFDPGWMFGLNEGFDIVIGNPPYGFRNVLSADEKKYFRQKRGIDFPTGDIAELFTLLAINSLTKPRGCCSFIIPKKSLYGERWVNIRRLWQQVNLVFLMDASQAFENVLLEQVAFLVKTSNSAIPNTAIGALNSNLDSVEIFGYYPLSEIFTQDLRNAQIYRGLFPDSLRRKLRNPQLIVTASSLIKARIGLSNVTKFFTEAEKGNYPCVKGIDIAPYGLRNPFRYLEGGIAHQYRSQYRGDKVVAQEIIAHIQNPVPHIQIAMFLDDEERLINDTCVEISIVDSRLDQKFAFVYLQSTFINWFAYNFVYNRAIRTMHFIDYYVGQLPFPRRAINEPALQFPVIKLAEEIIVRKKEDVHSDVSELVKAIDYHIYDLLQLDNEEREIIADGRLPQKADTSQLDTVQREQLYADEESFILPTPLVLTQQPQTDASFTIFAGQAPTGNFSERKEAVERLGRDGSPQAAQDLAAALADDNMTIRFLAAAQLRQIGLPALPAIRAFLRSTTDPVAKKEAEAVVTRIESW